MSFSYFEHATEPAIETVQDMQDGLELALGEKGISLTDTNDATDAVIGVSPDLLWVNKAVYRATRYMSEDDELPVLYTWFRFGPSVPINLFQTTSLNPISLGKYSRNEYESREESKFSPYDYMQFFKELIREDSYFAKDASITEFLLDLYHTEAPDHFRTLYRLNVKLQSLLADLKSINQATPMTDARVDGYWDSFEALHHDFRSALYKSKLISEKAADHVIEFLNVLRQVLEWLKGQGILDSEMVNPINKLWFSYQNSVWKWPAYWISYRTNSEEKPAGSEFRDHTKKEMNNKKDSWVSEIRNIRGELRQHGIIDSESTRNEAVVSGEAVSQIDSAILDPAERGSIE